MMKKIVACIFALCLLCSVCWAPNWSTLSVDVVVAMDTSAPGTTLTTAIANAGTVSSACAVGESCEFASVPSGWTVGPNQSECTNLGPVQLNDGGPLYSANSLDYNNLAHLDSANGSINNFTFSARPTSFTIAGCIALGVTEQPNGDDTDLIMIQDVQGNYADMQLQQTCSNGGQAYGMNIETHTVAHSPCIPLTPQGTYFFSLNWNTTTSEATLYIYTPQGTQVGTSSITDTAAAEISNVRIFSNENESDGNTTYYQNIMMNWTTAPNPLFWTNDGTAPQPPTNLAATVQ